MIKFFFKWLFRLVLGAVILVVVLAIILLLTYNSILRTMLEHNIRAQTGMDAEIGRLHVSLTEPTIEIQDFRIYNPVDFGGTPFLDISEIHIEYDLSALRKGQLHIPLVRVKLAELDIVKNQKGQLNILAMNPQLQTVSPPVVSSSPRPAIPPAPAQPNTIPPTTPKISPGGNAPPTRPPASNPPVINFEEQTGLVFTEIDKINLSYEKEKYIDLQNPANDCEQVVGLDNWIIPHVKNMNDLAGTMVYIDWKSGQFFQYIAQKNFPGAHANVLQDSLKSMGL